MQTIIIVLTACSQSDNGKLVKTITVHTSLNEEKYSSLQGLTMTTQAPKISMFILMQNNLEQAIAFYLKLGYTLSFQIPNQWAEFDAHGIKLGLAYTDTDLPERRTGIILEIDDLHQWCKEQATQGISCGEPVERLHGIMSSIKDPGNNILELYQPTPEKVHQSAQNMQEDT